MYGQNEFRGIDLFEKTFRHQISKSGEIESQSNLFQRKFGGGTDENPVEAGRYRLIWMPGCPHAHKVVITLRLLGLEQAISIGMTGIYRSEKGWVFGERPEDVDPVLKIHYLHDIYTREEPDYEGRSTVPIIVDTITGKGANNDHFWLSIYLSTAWKKYHKPDAPDLYPTDLRDEIDELNRFIYERINDGVYNCGFARSQDAYDLAYERFFEAMDLMDARLKDRRFLFGDFVTDSDLRIYPSLARFYITYYQVFRVNRTRLEDFENLWGYAKDLYRIPEIRDTTHFDLIKKHYQLSPHLRPLWGNVNGICAKGPDVGIWEEPHGRARLSGHPGERFLR